MLKNIGDYFNNTLKQANKHIELLTSLFKDIDAIRHLPKQSNDMALDLSGNLAKELNKKDHPKKSFLLFHSPNNTQLGNYETFYWNSKKYSLYYLNKKIITVGNYYKTNPLVIQFLSQATTDIVIYQDADTLALKLEIESLEQKLGLFDSERAELEKLLADFNHRHMLELGEIISEILALKKELAKENDDDIAFEETQNFEEQYHEELHHAKQKTRHRLNDQDQKLLKKLYRKASSLCHPDRVGDEQKALAEEIFNELRQAYEENDLAKVQELLAQLEQGIFKPQSKTVSQADKLRAIKQQMTGKLQRILTAINDIKKSPSYQEIMEIDDWDTYFAEQKSLLMQEKERLKERLNFIRQEKSIEIDLGETIEIDLDNA